MEALKRPDYPIQALGFILTRLIFNPAQRNLTNYDFRRQYGGFIELDWFDLSARQMLSQLSPWPRQDVDFTDIDRYLVGRDPENCDVADFYSDEAQILWHSLSGYLELVMALDIRQEFLCSEKIAILAAVHLGHEYPKLMEGILLSATKILRDGFDVSDFMRKHMENPESLRWIY